MITRYNQTKVDRVHDRINLKAHVLKTDYNYYCRICTDKETVLEALKRLKST